MNDLEHVFALEARELLEQLGLDLVALGRGQAVADLRERMFRAAHTLKGTARVVGREAIAQHAHAFEDLLATLPIDGPPAPEALRELRELTAACERELKSGGTIAERTATVAAAHDEAAPATVRVELDDLTDMLSRLDAARAALERADQAVVGLGRAAAPEWTRVRRMLRDELAIAGRELSAARRLTDTLRLVPLAGLFPALEISAHDAAAAGGKRVELELVGGEVTLDAPVLAGLREALSQVVRNAVEHGVEPPAERIAAGKAPAGRVRLEAKRHGQRVRITCSDDGRGVDGDALIRRARDRGLLDPHEAERLDEAGRLALAFHPGLSSRSEATALSGRGVGLDIVRASATRLGGTAELAAAPGAGTTLTLDMPTSLASFAALLAEAGPAAIALPLEAVVEVVHPRAGAIGPLGEGEALFTKDGPLPYMRLAAAFGVASAAPPAAVVVVRAGADRAAIGVCRLGGVAELVTMPLPAAAGAQPMVASVALDALGRPRPVLDPPGLLDAARRSRQAAPVPVPLAPRVLVVDDSLTTRTLVARVLEGAGYAVEQAADGEQGLARARAGAFDLLVVDVEMPRLDGFELVARLRGLAEGQATPVIMLTSRDRPGDRRRGLEVGAQAYLIKGEFDHATFLATVRGLVGR